MATDPYSFSAGFYEELLEKCRALKVAETRINELETLVREAGYHKFLGKDKNGQWNPNLFKRVDVLELSIRSQNVLQSAGVEFVYQLVERHEHELRKFKNCGRAVLNEIKEILSDLDLSLDTKLVGFPTDGVDVFDPEGEPKTPG